MEEIEALVREAANESDALIFRVAAFAGLRRGEIVSLRWRHIDLARSLVHVVENVSAGQDARVKDHEGRSVPIAPQLAATLDAWRPPYAQPADLVLPGTLPGRKLDGDALSTRYRKARDRGGLRPLRFHDLRHTFGSLATDGGASLVQVQAWATATLRRRCATCTPRAVRPTPGYSATRSLRHRQLPPPLREAAPE